MVLATLALQLVAAALLGALTLGLASSATVRRGALWLRATPVPRVTVYGTVASTALLIAVAAGGFPAPFDVRGLGVSTVVLLTAGLPMAAFLLSGHLELFAAADVLADLWAEGAEGDLQGRLAVARYLVRTHHDWASTACFLAGLAGLVVGVSLSLAPEATLRTSGLVYTTVGFYGLGVAGLTADYPYLRVDTGPVVREIDRLVAARDGD